MSKRLLFIYLPVLAFLSLNPWVRPSSEPVMGFVTWDKIDHAVAYGILAILMILAFRKEKRRFSSTVMAVLASTGIGIFAEFSQSWFTATRDFSWFDAYANGLGAIIGAAGFWSFRVFSGAFVLSKTTHDSPDRLVP